MSRLTLFGILQNENPLWRLSRAIKTRWNRLISPRKSREIHKVVSTERQFIIQRLKFCTRSSSSGFHEDFEIFTPYKAPKSHKPSETVFRRQELDKAYAYFLTYL